MAGQETRCFDWVWWPMKTVQYEATRVQSTRPNSVMPRVQHALQGMYVWRLRCTHVQKDLCVVGTCSGGASGNLSRANDGGLWHAECGAVDKAATTVLGTDFQRRHTSSDRTASSDGPRDSTEYGLRRASRPFTCTASGAKALHGDGAYLVWMGGIEASIKVAWVLHVRGSLSTDRSRFPPLRQPHRSLSAR